MSFKANAPAPNTPYFTPAQSPPSGTALDPQPEGKEIPLLFQPIQIRGVKFHNRIWLSPLCQYSADNGSATPWHLAHLGGIFTRGPGFSLVEATAVLPQGRISPEDLGIWSDEHVEPLRKIVEFAHSQNVKIGIQLAHAGRKASVVTPWIDWAHIASEESGGWPDDVWAPSALKHSDPLCQPKELSKEGIKGVVRAFVEGAKRALKAGFDVIEIHGAHGYLINQFLSPTSNQRTDEYGGSFENRARFALQIVDAVRTVIPDSMPLFFRISATEWLETALPNSPSWTVPDTVRLAALLADHGVDLLDVSSGGNHALQQIQSAPGYQVPFAEAVKKAVGDDIFVSAVGGLHTGPLAESVLQKGQADAIFVGSYFQKNPSAVWTFAEELGVSINVAHQIELGYFGRGGISRHHGKPKAKTDVAKKA